MKFADILPARRYTIMEERADYVLNKFNYKYPEQIDIEQVCHYYKIKIKPSPEPDLTYSVCTGFRRGFIFLPKINDYLTFKELAGEEFGHLYLHAISQMNTTKTPLNYQERQARELAACLYVPLYMLREMRIFLDQPVDITLLAEHFQVSEAFMYYRLSLLFPGKGSLCLHAG